MKTIADLTPATSVEAGDLLPVWSQALGQTVGVPLTNLAADFVGEALTEYRGFETRAMFVSWAQTATPNLGAVAHAAGYSYRYTGSGSVIVDLPGWVPLGDAYPDHWKQNITPGTTDMATAIIAAAALGAVYFAGTTYAVGQRLSFNKGVLIGAALDGAGATVILGLSASIPAANAILALGGKASVRRLRIEYDTLTGTETAGQRVGLTTHHFGGTNPTLQRGSVVDEVYFNNVGTAIDDDGAGCFNVSFPTITIENYSYAAVRIEGEDRTGNIWGNLRISSTTYAPTYGVKLVGGTGEEFRNANVEHASFKEAAFFTDGVKGLLLGKLHLEGVDTAAADKSYAYFANTSAKIDLFTAVNTRMTTYDNVSVIKLGRAGSLATGAAGRDFTQAESLLHIGTLFLQGLADPSSSLYPSYPAGRLGVYQIPGFTIFKREASYTDGYYRVAVDSYIGGPFNNLSPADDAFYAFPDQTAVGVIEFVRFKDRGRWTRQPQNLLVNGAFDRWHSTTATITTEAAEFAPKWVARATTGTVVIDRMADADGAPNAYYPRFTVTAGTFQAVEQDIRLPTEWLGKRLRLAFEMKAASAGQVFNQITANLDNAGGSPTSVTLQVRSGSNADVLATTAWKYYSLEFDAVASASVTSFGDDPFMRLQIQFNAGSATLSPTVHLRKVRLEKVAGEQFDRDPRDRMEILAADVRGLDTSNLYSWLARPGQTSLDVQGFAAPTAVGTATAASVAATSAATYAPRLDYLQTTPSTTAIAGAYGPDKVVSVGGAANSGGFRAMMRWTPATGVSNATHRAFCGLATSTSAPTDVEPSSLVNCVGMGWDAADAQVQFLVNNGSGACTKIPLGPAFAVPTSDLGVIYELRMFSPKGAAQSLTLEARELISGAVARAYVDSNLPITTTLLAPRVWLSAGGTSSVCGVGLSAVQISRAV